MTKLAGEQPPSDADLTAYLDGELDMAERRRIREALRNEPALRARLELLSAGARPFREAFDALLQEAPSARLQAFVANARPPARDRARPQLTSSYRRATALCIAFAVVFIVGLGSDRVLQRAFDRGPSLDDGETAPEAPQAWRQEVANQFRLVSERTISSIPDDGSVRAKELAAVADGLGIALPPERIALAAARFKRAEMLEYEGRPLAQVLYDHTTYGPVSLCIMRSQESDSPLQTEERRGFNIAFWAANGFSYMLVGRNPPSDLLQLARSLAARLPA